MSAWRTIDSAPKDGTPVLLWLKEPFQKTHVHSGIIRPNVSVIAGHFAFDLPPATHWQPIPPGPIGVDVPARAGEPQKEAR